MDSMTLTEIRRAAQNGAVPARVHVQVEAATAKTQREGKPYCELALADACDRMTLRVWSDHPAYKTCSSLSGREFVELTAEFHTHSQYGLDARKWTVRPLTEQEKNELLQGPADLRAKQAADWEFITETIQRILDPRLSGLCEAFLKEWGDRFRRTATARNYHHAHHGEMEFGSPVAPKTPEAMALHYIDNLDARLEMFAAAYTTAKPLAARIFDRVRPLPGNLVKSLEKFQRPTSSKEDTLL